MRRFFFVFLVLVAPAVLAADEKLKGEIKAEGTGKNNPAKIKICDVCNCTEKTMDCSNRGLNMSVFDYDFPADKHYDVLDFSHNKIGRIRPLPTTQVFKLVFRNNNVSIIDDHSFKLVANLTELDLSHNSLSFESLSPHAFRGHFSSESYETLKKLRKLDLSHNNFISLKPNIFEHVTGMTHLNLSHNPLKVFNQMLITTITTISLLEDLSMSHCQFKKIDATAMRIHQRLKILDLSYNLFQEPPNVLEDVNSLESLILDGNPIVNLTAENGFPSMKSLKALSMSDMPKLVWIGEGSMCHLQALESLRITNCPNFTDIDEDALALKSSSGGTTWPLIKALDLSNNALKYLPDNLIARWDDVKQLHLKDNQWHCDCDNQNLIGVILPKYGKKLMGSEASELRCAAPPEHSNRTLESLAGWKLRCPDMYGARPERDSAVLIGMLVGVLLSVPIVLVFFVFWKRGYFFCSTQGPAAFSRAFYKRTPPFEDDV
ncbi:toll-like receptor 13 [Copidosoma floridanum]|uniref:toll-like receptor 13 n=1 Tax=Copidosoma floridanum TaxID=29053 RepID=UPI0006C996D2|nr:toll-like receptor 13 [Copidosoma floridanum]